MSSLLCNTVICSHYVVHCTSTVLRENIILVHPNSTMFFSIHSISIKHKLLFDDRSAFLQSFCVLFCFSYCYPYSDLTYITHVTVYNKFSNSIFSPLSIPL